MTSSKQIIFFKIALPIEKSTEVVKLYINGSVSRITITRLMQRHPKDEKESKSTE